MKELEHGWPDVQYLYCRSHIYEAIKHSCSKWFSNLPKGTRHPEMNRFIHSFKNVVIAPTCQ